MSITRKRLFAATITGSLAAATIVALGTATPAAASTFTVTKTADGPDSNPGNGSCWSTAAAGCTLRAAVMEANAHPGADTITLPAGTYTVTSTLVIEDGTTINGASADTTIISGGGTVSPVRIATVGYLVCDVNKDRLVAYDRNGQWKGTFNSSGSGGLNAPVAAHEVYNSSDYTVPDVLVTATSGIHRFSASGVHEAKLVDAPAAGIAYPSDAVPGPNATTTYYDNSIFLADYYPNGKVRKYSQSGSSLGTFVAHGSGGLDTPNSIEFRGSTMYVVDASSDKVLRYNSTTGAYLGSSSTGDAPRDIAFRSDGTFVVSNWGANSVYQYSATGTLLGPLVAAGSGGLNHPTGLALGPDNSLLVVSAGTKQVLRYDLTSGAYKGVFATGGSSIYLDAPSCLLKRTGVGAGPLVTINRVTVADGRADTAGSGGIINETGATLQLIDSVVRDNDGTTSGGGIGNWGSLTLLRSSVRDNTLPQGGGGLTSSGGGIYNQGTLTLTRSSVTGNFATRGGGIAQTAQGTTNLTNSTISGNKASGGSGGGLLNRGTGRFNISFSTITKNETVAYYPGDNTRRGGGITNEGDGARISMAGSVLAQNSDGYDPSSPSYGPDCYSPLLYNFTSERSNLVGILSSTCSLRDSTWGTATFGNQIGSPASPKVPGLNSLSTPAGFVFGVHNPSGSSSAVVDTATSVSSSPLSTCPSTDQKGGVRPADGNGDGTPACDIGAVER